MPIIRFFSWVLAVCLFVLPASAAVYTNTFAQADGALLYNASVESGALTLASGPSAVGSAIVDDLEGGGGIAGVTFDFLLKATGSGGGFSVSVAPDVQDAPFGQGGSGSGFILSFINSEPGMPGAVVATREGQTVASAVANFATGTFVPVRIELGTDGALTVTVNNQVVIDRVFAYLPIPGRFGFGASTSNGGGEFAIDNLGIRTVSQTGPFVLSASPTGPGASPGSVIIIQIQDFGADVDPASVRLSFNGAPITALVGKEGGTTTVTYDPPGNLPTGSRNTIDLSFTAGGQPRTARYAFTVAAVPVIPASWAHTIVDTAAAGFRLRVVQAPGGAQLTNNIARAEAQLRGALVDSATGEPYPNEANLASAGPSGFIQEAGVINYAESGAPGFFPGDQAIPGIPGTTGHANNFAIEVITWLHLQAGAHRFGVNSDDGFELRVGPNARDVTSLVLGRHNAARTTGETLMDFIVAEAGFYSFRLLWFQGEGQANLEWYSVHPESGERILINNAAHPEAIRAYRSGPFFPYLSFASPAPGSIAETNATIELRLANGEAAVLTNTIQVRLNNISTSPAISAAGTNETLITFTPANGMAPGSIQTVAITYTDASQRAFTNQLSFLVAGGSEPARLNIERLADGRISVTWSGGGTLEETPDLRANGTVWTAVTGAAAGQYITEAAGSRRFFRVRR